MDIERETAATDPIVGERARDDGTMRTVTLDRTYPTDVDDLWSACTEAARLARWLAPVTGDLVLGGRYAIEGNASGSITACDPPRGFDATWEVGDSTSWIEVRMHRADGGARLELTHVAHVDTDFWDRYGPGATGVGWDLALLGLAWSLRGAMHDPAEGEAWAVSPEGAAFITASGREWERASVLAGMDAVEAAGMADRTIAFFTGAEA